MRLRKPTKEEKAKLLDWQLNRRYGRTNIEEERQGCAEEVEYADIAVLDYHEGYKTMVVLWEREECYSEIFTLQRHRFDGEKTKHPSEIDWLDGKHEQSIERAELEQAWELVDEIMDDQIEKMIHTFQVAIIDAYTKHGFPSVQFNQSARWAEMKLRHSIVMLKFPPERDNQHRKDLQAFAMTMTDEEWGHVVELTGIGNDEDKLYHAISQVKALREKS